MIPIRRFTDRELIILAALADDKGHALWDLEQRTKIGKTNLKPKIDSLVGNERYTREPPGRPEMETLATLMILSNHIILDHKLSFLLEKN